MSTIEKNFDDLIDLMIEQGKAFLDELGEFFPYGSILTSERKLKTIGLYNDNDENFNVQKAINILSERISEGIKNQEILIGAIGIDVFLENKTNAIMIRATDDGKEWHERSYPYKIIDGLTIIEKTKI